MRRSCKPHSAVLFEIVRQIAITATNAGVGMMLTVQNGCFDTPWQVLFPKYTELFARPVLLIICVFLLRCV